MVPAPVKIKDATTRGAETISAAVSVVTPVFGGGVYLDSHEHRRQIKDADPLTPLRAAAIRGHLRFWWRACQGNRFGSSEEMWKAEAVIWGAASQPGAVSLRIEDQRLIVRDLKVFDMVEGKTGKYNPRAPDDLRAIAYGAFPLQPKGGLTTKLEPGVLHLFDGSATLILTAPAALAAEARAALRAWLAFGGIGGRTRRGFGAVVAAELVDPVLVLKELGGPGPALEGVSSLHGARLRIAKKTFGQAREGLSWGLEALQRFRQGVNVGRNPQADKTSKKPAGRSRWPEPEVIRQRTGQAASLHKECLVKVDKFPRAAFGMPLIFHFSDQNDPEDTTLKPREAERLASPLIIRPYRMKDGKFGCLALVLRDDRREDLALVLQGKGNQSWDVQAGLSAEEASRIKPLGGNIDPLAAFLEFFAQA